MTTINNLPEEVLSLIFKRVEFEDILQCQKVCRAWYHPAHLIRLNEVEFECVAEIDNFIAAIDHNPDPSYLGAVKKLSISTLSENHDNYEFDIQKMMLRFRNLKDVDLKGQLYLTKAFNDQVCKDLMNSCPKLDAFKMDSFDSDQQRFNALHNVRLLLTSIRVDEELARKFRTAADIVTSFPRLKELECYCNYSFQDLLPAFEFENGITILVLKMLEGKQDFADRQLRSKPTKQKDQIKKQLAQIQHLFLDSFADVNTILFVSKYLTGLQSFHLRNIHCSNDFHEVFCNNVLDLVCQAKQYSYASTTIKFRSLSRSFATIMHKFFQNCQFGKELHLHVNNIKRQREYRTKLDISSHDSHLQQSVNISIVGGYELSFVVNTLFGERNDSVPFDVDFFSLDCSDTSETTSATSMNPLDKIFKRMPTLKEVYLDLPSYSLGTGIDQDNVYLKLEKMTLQSTAAINVNFQLLLDRFALVFPCIKHLNLYSFSGGEYQVDLKNYALESLAIEVSPLKVKQFSKSEYDFFVVQVEIENEKKMYKVIGASLTVKKIEEVDLKDFTHGEDYYRIDITLASLKRLEILLKGDENRKGYFVEHPYSYCSQRIFIDI